MRILSYVWWNFHTSCFEISHCILATGVHVPYLGAHCSPRVSLRMKLKPAKKVGSGSRFQVKAQGLEET